MKKAKKILLLMALFGLVLSGVALYTVARAETQAETAAGSMSPEVVKWGFLAAAIVTGLSTVGAGIAVGYVGSAALGTISEKPEMAGRALIFVGLAEGIAIYGLIIAIMILGKVS